MHTQNGQLADREEKLVEFVLHYNHGPHLKWFTTISFQPNLFTSTHI